MPPKETKQHTEEKAVYKVTAAELTVLQKYLARLEAKPSVRLKVTRNGCEPQIGFDHPDKLVGHALVMDALASADGDFLNGIVSQLAAQAGKVRASKSAGSTSCCQSSKVLSRGISSRQCLRPRWRPSTWRA